MTILITTPTKSTGLQIDDRHLLKNFFFVADSGFKKHLVVGCFGIAIDQVNNKTRLFQRIKKIHRNKSLACAPFAAGYSDAELFIRPGALNHKRPFSVRRNDLCLYDNSLLKVPAYCQ